MWIPCISLQVLGEYLGEGVLERILSRLPFIQSSRMQHFFSPLHLCVCIFDFQVLLSSEDLKMMMEEVKIGQTIQGDSDDYPSFVNLRTFLHIMEYSSW
jgi:hypothetical protein